jgi:hypothetical protein
MKKKPNLPLQRKRSRMMKREQKRKKQKHFAVSMKLLADNMGNKKMTSLK